MIEIEKIELEKKAGISIENAILSIAHLNALIKIIKFNWTKYYEVSLHKGDTTFINEYIDCPFSEFLKYKSKFLPYELELLNIRIDQETIDDFKPIFRICSQSNQALIKVDLVYIPLLSGAVPHQISNSKWSTQYLINQFEILIKERMKLKFYQDKENSRIGLEFPFDPSKKINESLISTIKELRIIGADLMSRVNQFIWKDSYSNDELLFSNEVILPLLRKMKFSGVKYTHGNQEFGRDFIFKEETKFSTYINYGIQVKAGNLSGKANNNIQELISQVQIAMKTPFYEIADDNKYFISIMIIAISGKFTNQAQQILLGEIPNYLKGSIIFWDKEKILELIEKYWTE